MRKLGERRRDTRNEEEMDGWKDKWMDGWFRSHD
jgi:hypothetical protein